MRSPQDFPRRLPRTSRRFRIGLVVAVIVLVIVVASLRTVADFWTDYLWFKEVHFTQVFRGVLVNEVILALIFSVAFFLLLLLNLTIVDRLAPIDRPTPDDELVTRYRQLVGHRGVWVRVVISAFFGLIGGVGARGQWNNWILLLHRSSFGVKDPINHFDIGFYVFELPFLRFLIGWVFEAVVVSIILSILFHYLNGGINLQVAGERVTRHVKTHISVLLAVLALIKAVDYYLERIEVVLNRKYIVNGATYTAVHAQRPAFIVLIVAALFAVGLFLYNIREKGWMLPGVAVGVWIVVYLLVGVAYPAFIEAVRVNPSQLTRETPYLAANISATRSAMGLNTVAPSGRVQGNAELTASDVSGTAPQAVANEQALANVRLLDPAFIGTAFNKDQVLRGFYKFNSLDVDRYDIKGQLTETLLSVRELNEAGVPSGFVNQKLVYTHGNGAAVAPANQSGVNSDGSVAYSLENLPPSGVPSLGSGAQSDVYYGAGSPTGGYVIAGSKQQEFDYPGANGQQVSNTYKGSGGVPAGSLFRRGAFALRFGDLNFLLSGQITSSSRVMYFRNISQRVNKAAPFLKLDDDPYSVILNNQVYWILDAYTVTDNYPDAQQAITSRLNGGSDTLAATTFNYVRNSVKVVVNAYTGKMTFFVVDTTDPIIRAYEKAFPDLFTNSALANAMFPGITSHWRYPEDLFTVQTDMYGRYQLTKPADFYSQGLSWVVAQDPGSGTPGSGTLIGSSALGANGQLTPVQAPRFTPDYILTHLPGSQLSQFLIFEPFVARSSGDTQQNLTGFMTGEFTPSGQATLQVFTTPPGAAVEGPLRAGSTIASTAVISQEITLLNTNGSTVKLGNLVPVLLNQTLLYVEPLYVESTSNPAAQLDDVIVVYNGQAYDSGNASLDAALCKIRNTDFSVPFASYCNTAAAQRTSTLGNITGSSGGSTSSSSTTSTTSTTAPSGTSTTLPPPQGTTVAQLLANAQLSLARGNAALASGNLAGYQADVNQASADIKAAAAAGGASPATGTTTTTTGASKATTSTSTAGATSSTAAASPTSG